MLKATLPRIALCVVVGVPTAGTIGTTRTFPKEPTRSMHGAGG